MLLIVAACEASSAADLTARIFRRTRVSYPRDFDTLLSDGNDTLSENQQLACRVTGSQHRLASLVDPKREGGDALSENSGIGQRNPASIQPADAWTVSNKRLASGPAYKNPACGANATHTRFQGWVGCTTCSGQVPVLRKKSQTQSGFGRRAKRTAPMGGRARNVRNRFPLHVH